MIDEVLHHLSEHGLFELATLVLGYGIARYRQYSMVFSTCLFLIRVLKWYMDTHPHGKEMAKKTSLDTQVEELLGITEKNTNKQPQKLTSNKTEVYDELG